MNKLDREALEQYGVLGWDRRSYAARLADACSQLANTLIGGMPDETLSGRSYRIVMLQQAGAPWRWQAIHRAAELLFFWQGGRHTENAFFADLERAAARARAAELFRRALS